MEAKKTGFGTQNHGGNMGLGRNDKKVSGVDQLRLRQKQQSEMIWNSMTNEEKIEGLFVDCVSGTLNKYAFQRMAPPPNRPWIGVIDVKGKKRVKNEMGWTARDALIRYVADSLMKEDPEVFRFDFGVGLRERPDFEGEFVVYLREEADLQGLMERATKRVPLTLDLNGTIIQRDGIMELVGAVGKRVVQPHEV